MSQPASCCSGDILPLSVSATVVVFFCLPSAQPTVSNRESTGRATSKPQIPRSFPPVRKQVAVFLQPHCLTFSQLLAGCIAPESCAFFHRRSAEQRGTQPAACSHSHPSLRLTVFAFARPPAARLTHTFACRVSCLILSTSFSPSLSRLWEAVGRPAPFVCV